MTPVGETAETSDDHVYSGRSPRGNARGSRRGSYRGRGGRNNFHSTVHSTHSAQEPAANEGVSVNTEAHQEHTKRGSNRGRRRGSRQRGQAGNNLGSTHLNNNSLTAGCLPEAPGAHSQPRTADFSSQPSAPPYADSLPRISQSQHLSSLPLAHTHDTTHQVSSKYWRRKGKTMPDSTFIPPHLRRKQQQESGFVPPHLRRQQQQQQQENSQYVPPHLRRQQMAAEKANKTPAPQPHQSNQTSSPPNMSTSLSHRIPTDYGRPVVRAQAPGYIHSTSNDLKPLPTQTKPTLLEAISSQRIPESSPQSQESVQPQKQQHGSSDSSKQQQNTAATSPPTHATHQKADLDIGYQEWMERANKYNDFQVDEHGWVINPPKSKPQVHYKSNGRVTQFPKMPKYVKKAPSSNDWGSDDYQRPRGEGVPIIKTEGWTEENADVHALQDWEGNWLPAPVEWEGRKGYRHKNFYQWMCGWRAGVIPDPTIPMISGFVVQDDGSEILEYVGNLGPVGERGWIPPKIGDESLQSYWKQLPDTNPQPVWDTDLVMQPWWLTFVKFSEPWLLSPDVPDAKIDPKDPELPDHERATTYSSDKACQLYMIKSTMATEKKKALRAKRRKEANEAFGKYEVERRAEALRKEERELKPSINIYLRPARFADINGILEIYNWHQQNSILPPETEPVKLQAIESRMRDIFTRSLPFIVAVEKKGKAVIGQFLQEKICGFAHLDDYHDQNGKYRTTTELELYVREDCRQQKVASCLIDQILSIIDSGYDTFRGYEWRCKDYYAKGVYERGSIRRVGKFVVHFPIFQGDVEFFKRVINWLDKFQITQVGYIDYFGSSGGQTTDMGLFAYTSSQWKNGYIPTGYVTNPQRPVFVEPDDSVSED